MTESATETQEITEAELELQRLRDENAALHKQLDAAKEIADEMDAAQRDEDDLKSRAKQAKERKDQLADSLAALVKGDVQTEVGEFIDPDTQERIAWTPVDEIDAKVQAGEVLHLKDIKWSKLSVISQLHSLGKPPKVVPVETISGDPFPGGLHIISDVHRPYAYFLPIFDAAQWDAKHPDVARLELPNSERTHAHDSLGDIAGCPVKVGRKTYWIGANSDAMIVAIPSDEVIGNINGGTIDNTTTDDEQDTVIDYGFVANRILAEIQANGADTVHTLSRTLDVSCRIIIKAADQHPELALIKDGDNPDAWTVSK